MCVGRNLFQRAIIQSGTALGTWSTVADPWTYARRLAEAVNCSLPGLTSPSAVNIMRCFKHVPANELVKPVIRAPKYFSAFGPTVDYRSVLPYNLRKLMSKSSDSVFAGTKLLIGVVKNEGLFYFNQRIIDEGLTSDQLRKVLYKLVRMCFSNRIIIMFYMVEYVCE